DQPRAIIFGRQPIAAHPLGDCVTNNGQSRGRSRFAAMLPKFLKSLPPVSLNALWPKWPVRIGTALAPSLVRKRDGASPDRWSSVFRRRAVRAPVEVGTQAAGSPLPLCLRGDDEVKPIPF